MKTMVWNGCEYDEVTSERAPQKQSVLAKAHAHPRKNRRRAETVAVDLRAITTNAIIVGEQRAKIAAR